MTCGSRKYAKRAPAASSRITNSSSSTTRKRSLKRRPSKSCRRITEFCRPQDRKSTRLNSSHSQISYAVFCLKKKKRSNDDRTRQSYPRSDGCDSSETRQRLVAVVDKPVNYSQAGERSLVCYACPFCGYLPLC